MDTKNTLDTIIRCMPERVRPALERSRSAYESEVREITLRAGRPLCVYLSGSHRYISCSGCVVERPDLPDILYITSADINDVFLRLCDYSAYSRQNECINGYLTADGGVRVGLCGSAVTRAGEVINIRDITTLSFRVPREVTGCADEVLSLLDPLCGVLICGPPCSGKTTVIRDMARTLSYTYRVSVIDERGELSASRCGVPGCDLGLSDVYINMPKGEAVISSVRSMSPDIIICDELGDRGDADSLRYAMRCGVSFIATVHSSSLDDLRTRQITRRLLADGAFRYIVILDGRRRPGRVTRVYEWGSADA